MVRVLVIDDNQDVRDLIQFILEGAGYSVELAPDGEAGLRSQRARPADVVITDIFMPNQDGLETIARLREEYPACQGRCDVRRRRKRDQGRPVSFHRARGRRARAVAQAIRSRSIVARSRRSFALNEMNLPTEPIGSIPRPPCADRGGRTSMARITRALGAALRGRGARHGAELRSDRLAGDHRRRAAQVPQLLDLPGPRARQHGAGRLSHPVRCRAHAPHAAAHAGPFRYKRYADAYLAEALRHATLPVKQAVISPSALSLMYPAEGCRAIRATSSSRT